MKKNLLCLLILGTALYACDTKRTPQTIEQEPVAAQQPDSLASPAPVKTDSTLLNEEVAQIQELLRTSLLKDDLEALTPEQRKFQYASYDLNDDGSKEYLVAFRNSYFCGSGGCTFMVIDTTGKVIGDFSVVDGPFIVSESKTNNWHDLLVSHNGQLHEMQNTGSMYPGNPLVAPLHKGKPSPEAPRLLANDSNLPSYSF